MSTENQIHLIGKNFRHEEIEAAGDISPGHLIGGDSSGTCVVHNTEGGVAARAFAEIDALQGNTLEDDYEDGDLVMVNIEQPGNECQAFLQAGQNAAIGDLLISAGDGTLIVNGQESSGVTVYDYIAVAREALDLSGSGAVDTLMRVHIL